MVVRLSDVEEEMVYVYCDLMEETSESMTDALVASSVDAIKEISDRQKGILVALEDAQKDIEMQGAIVASLAVENMDAVSSEPAFANYEECFEGLRASVKESLMKATYEAHLLKMSSSSQEDEHFYKNKKEHVSLQERIEHLTKLGVKLEEWRKDKKTTAGAK